MKEKLKCAMDLGEQMLLSGAEIHRIEDTMTRVLIALGGTRADTFIITTCMIVSVHAPNGEVFSETRRLTTSSTDFEKLHLLNALSRRICSEEMTCEQIHAELDKIKATKVYPLWVEFIAYALITSSFTLFFGGDLVQSLIALVIGVVMRAVVLLADSTVKNKVFSKFVASFVSTALAFWAVRLCLTDSFDEIIIGNIMPLIPGIGFTNSLRDIFTGDSIAGIIRLLEALIAALAIAAGYIVFMAVGGVSL